MRVVNRGVAHFGYNETSGCDYNSNNEPFSQFGSHVHLTALGRDSNVQELKMTELFITPMSPLFTCFFKVSVSLVVLWHCPFQPMALVSLWLSSGLQLLKSAPICPRERVCNQPDQVPGLPHCGTSKTLALAQKGAADRGGLWAVGLDYPMA